MTNRPKLTCQEQAQLQRELKGVLINGPDILALQSLINAGAVIRNDEENSIIDRHGPDSEMRAKIRSMQAGKAARDAIDDCS